MVSHSRTVTAHKRDREHGEPHNHPGRVHDHQQRDEDLPEELDVEDAAHLGDPAGRPYRATSRS